jgi:hypothetical protein
MTLFEKDRSKTGGRGKGVRNKLSHAFLEALHRDFEQHGEEAIKIARIERPIEYIKVVAGILPKEFEITDNRLQELSDDELEAIINYWRTRRGSRVEDITKREEQTLN